MSRKSLRRKSAKRKLRNIVWLVSLLAIVVGIYFNIYNSRAEEVIKIGASVLDNYGYLENEEIELEAKHIGDDLYEIELPESINTKKILNFVGITLQNSEEIQEDKQAEKIEELATTNDANEIVENTNEAEQEVAESTKIEIKDNKIQLTKEQLENQELNLEVKYDIALLEKLEDGNYKKESLSAKTEEEIKALAEAEMLYSKILKYEDEQNGKQVELKGYLPKDAELKVEEVAQEKLTEVFGKAKIDVAYDIKILVKEIKQVLVDENNPEGETKEVVEYKEINPEEFGEQCQVSIKDSKIAEDSQVYHVKEDNTFEHVKVKQNDEESISFEAQTFSIYAITTDKSVMVASGSDITPPEIVIGTKKDVVTAETLTVDDYGGYITNYTPINGANDAGIKWRIFHSDGDNIYLIADTYVPVNAEGMRNYIPVLYDMTVSTHTITLPTSGYTGTSDIDNEIASKLLHQYNALGYTLDNEEDNGKATAYLLDTDLWFGFKDNKYADYAIGSPTIELFKKSYNAKYPNKAIETRPHPTGYDVDLTTGTFGRYSVRGLEEDELYIISDTFGDTVYGMWLASPSGYDATSVMTAFSIGNGVGYSGYSLANSYGVRPVIALKSDTKLEKLGNNQYELTDSDTIDGNSTWQYEHDGKITIIDKESGVSSAVSSNNILIAWSESNTVEPTNWNYISMLASEGFVNEQTYEIEFMMETVPTSGKYYLWAKAEGISDNSGNTTTKTAVSNKPYYFDKTAPTMQFGNRVNATLLTAEDYGGYVTNYTPTNGVNDEGIKWRIFHSDGDNIYLIADTYVPTESLAPIYSSAGEYGFNLAVGGSNMETIDQTIASKWLSQYTMEGYTATNTNINGQATTVLLATGAWSGFKDGKYADYAVGAPTIELFAESYNITHPNKKIKTQAEPTGYSVAWDDASFDNEVMVSGLDTSGSLYVISNTFDDTVMGTWLASPSTVADYRVWNVSNIAALGAVSPYDATSGSRPIICLKSDTQLIKKANGTYEIIDEYTGGNETWAKSYTETISILDEESGVQGSYIYPKYAWSKSNDIRPTEWEDATISTNSDKKLTYEITATGLTGKYYLWVGGGNQLTDNTGINSIYGDPTMWADEKVSGPYYFDNTAPEIIITADNEITAGTLSVEDYGGYVTNYNPTNGVNNAGVNWRIFHSDGENIYLIADSYVPVDGYVPTGYSATSEEYGFDLYGYENYNGTSDIASDIANKWLKKYTTAGYTATSTKSNAKATAYLLDKNAWSGFKDSKYADYAVGTPTLELFTSSYNKTHPTRTIETQVNETGYEVAWSDGSFGNHYIEGLDTSGSLYIITNSTAWGMWLASPSFGYEDSVMFVNKNGAMSYSLYDSSSLRCSSDSFSKIRC